MDNNRNNIYREGYMPLNYYPQNWFYNIRHFFRTLKWANQRARRGYSDIDVYNLKDYLMRVLIGSLRHMADRTMSYPIKYALEGDDDGDEEWAALLREMADFFDKGFNWENPDLSDFQDFLAGKISKDELSNIWRNEMKEGKENREKGFNLLMENFDDLWI